MRDSISDIQQCLVTLRQLTAKESSMEALAAEVKSQPDRLGEPLSLAWPVQLSGLEGVGQRPAAHSAPAVLAGGSSEALAAEGEDSWEMQAAGVPGVVLVRPQRAARAVLAVPPRH